MLACGRRAAGGGGGDVSLGRVVPSGHFWRRRRVLQLLLGCGGGEGGRRLLGERTHWDHPAQLAVFLLFTICVFVFVAIPVLVHRLVVLVLVVEDGQ